MQLRQDKWVDIEANLPEGSLELPRFDRLAQTDIKHGVRADPGHPSRP